MIRLEQIRFSYNHGDDVLRLPEFVLECYGRSARPTSIAMMLMLEALILAVLGGLFGLLLAHGLAGILAWWMAKRDSLPINAWVFSARELWLLVPSLMSAILAALLPSWRASRTNISATLARRG